jgi:serine/threonine-protein kinase
MLPAQVQDALAVLSSELSSAEASGGAALREALDARWRALGGDPRGPLSAGACAAADVLDRALPTLTRSASGVADLAQLFGGPPGDVVLLWCAANVSRRDARLARLLAAAAEDPELGERVVVIARARIVEGPLHDALGCAPLVGSGAEFALPENAQARARMEILFWEAGASALAVPELGPWLWGSEKTFAAMIAEPAHGSLRGRVLAARCLEVCVRGMPPMTDPRLVGRTLQVLQPLLLHPEPLVWVHAARALGRLTGSVEQLEGTLLDWVRGESPLLQQRAMTAFASLPSERLKFLGSELTSMLDAPAAEAWVLAAAAAATPYLFFENRAVWDRLAARILAGDGGAIASRALARGLATLWRRGAQQSAIEAPLRQLREMARRTRTDALDECRRWLEVIAVTDPVDGAERDPLDLELGLENLVRLAAQFDDEEADARAARFADALGPTFVEARRIALGAGSLRHRAAALNAFEGCARALALRLWGPLLDTRPQGNPVEQPNLDETWSLVARAPEELLDVVRERRQAVDGTARDPQIDLALEVLAIRLGGYALDACGEDPDFGPGRGPTAHDTCLWLRKLDGLADGSRDLPAPLKNALSALFWRLVDTTRGTALGEVDDVRWLGPFAAWWGLVIDRPAMLLSIATALPMIAEGALEKCCSQAEVIRTTVASGASDGAWGPAAAAALKALHADDTELAQALAGLASGLEKFAAAAGPKPNLEEMCLQLVLAAERVHAALADPVKALHPATDASTNDSLSRAATENAPRVAALIARSIRARELSMLDVWFTSLGPVSSGLVEAAVLGAVRRTPPPPPAKKKPIVQTIEGYELVKPIGEGGIGTVWLVRKPGADRFFVLKIPKADALANATDTERAGILASFIEEAKALAGLYHPNVANIIERGVSNGAPFLVLELLIGADLQQYATAKLMSLFELRQVVLESCAGLAALHGAGLVHRDIKPANLWLRLPLASGEKFDPDKHRDPARTQPLATVVIDFGMVRAMRVAPDAAGRFVAGTPGYIAPEQVLDPVELDGRADVYALAGTIYTVTTGRKFFDDVESPRDRILAHMNRDPLEDADRLKTYPAALVKLMRAATDKDPRDRPQPLEFGREFVACL